MATTLEYILKLSSGAFTGPANAAGRALRGIGGTASAITSKVAGLTAQLGALAGAGSLVGAAMKGIKGAADMEQLEVAFEVFTGSAQTAQKTLKELAQLGASTPFEFPELAQAGSALIAFGESASDVTSVLSRVGDIASGVRAPIGEIAEIYGKARVNGTLFAEDINQLTGRGIPIIQEFAKVLGVSESEVKKLASEGKVTFSALEQGFKNLTGAGGKFEGMMKRQSGTTAGLWSTVQDTLGEISRTIAKPINEHFLKPLMQDTLALAPKVIAAVNGAVKMAKTAMANGQLGGFLESLLNVGFAKAAGFGAQIIGTAIGGAIKATTAGIGKLFSGGIGGILVGIGDIIRGSFGDAFNGVVLDFQARLTYAVQKVLALIGQAPEPGSLKQIRQDLADAQGGGDAAGLIKAGQAKIDQAFGIDAFSADLAKAIEPVQAAAADAAKAMDAMGKATNAATDAERKKGKGAAPGKDGERKRSQGFSREAAGLPAFGGLNEFFAKQAGSIVETPISRGGKGRMSRTLDAFFQGSDRRFQDGPRRMSALEAVKPIAERARMQREEAARAAQGKQVPPRWETVDEIAQILKGIVPL